MNFSAVGDLSKLFTQRFQNAALQSELGRLSGELASGETSDLSKQLRGDFSSVARIGRGLMSASAYETVISETRLRADSMQTALEKVQEAASTSASGSLAASITGQVDGLEASSAEAARQLDDVLLTLNTKVADQALFSGVATDQAPLADANTLFAALDPLLAGASDAGAVQTIVQTWMDDPAGFEATMYQGSTAVGAHRVSDSQSITLDVTAIDPAVKDVIEGMILGSLVSRGTLAANVPEQAALTKASAEALLTADSGFTALRAALGNDQARLDQASAAVGAEITGLNVARNELIGVNPFETASKLEATKLQIEMLYTVTARVSRLSLADYI